MQRAVAGWGGYRLGPGDLGRLRLTLPVALPDWLVRQLTAVPWLGAHVELDVDAQTARPEPLCLCLFDVDRLLLEALEHEPGKSLLASGFLALGGCGRRGITTYAVALAGQESPLVSSNPGFRTLAEAPPPVLRCAGVPVTLTTLSTLGRPSPSASLRQRLPRRRSAGSRMPTRARAKPSGNPSLSLFDRA
jgi:hypothetical protein